MPHLEGITTLPAAALTARPTPIPPVEKSFTLTKSSGLPPVQVTTKSRSSRMTDPGGKAVVNWMAAGMATEVEKDPTSWPPRATTPYAPGPIMPGGSAWV